MFRYYPWRVVYFVQDLFSLSAWRRRWYRWRHAPKVGSLCRYHGAGPVLSVVEVQEAGAVLLSDGILADWWHCCEEVTRSGDAGSG